MRQQFFKVISGYGLTPVHLSFSSPALSLCCWKQHSKPEMYLHWWLLCPKICFFWEQILSHIFEMTGYIPWLKPEHLLLGHYSNVIQCAYSLHSYQWIKHWLPVNGNHPPHQPYLNGTLSYWTHIFCPNFTIICHLTLSIQQPLNFIQCGTLSCPAYVHMGLYWGSFTKVLFRLRIEMYCTILNYTSICISY